MHARSRLAIALLILVAGCRTGAGPARLPATPYTSEQIRDECRPGTRLVFQLTPPGGAAGTQQMLFLDGPAGSAHFQIVMPADSEGAGMEASATWDEVRDHAAFDLDVTTRRRETIEVGAGTFDCWHYVVPTGEGVVEHYWFALGKPGPPVLLEARSQGQITSRMELLEYERAAAH